MIEPQRPLREDEQLILLLVILSCAWWLWP